MTEKKKTSMKLEFQSCFYVLERFSVKFHVVLIIRGVGDSVLLPCVTMIVLCYKHETIALNNDQ